MVGKFVTVAAMVNGANNGTFLITAQSATTIGYVNASGVVEANIVATFDVFAPYMIEDDIAFEQTDRKNIKGTAQHYTDVPTYERPSAVGTAIPNNLTNILSVDKYAKVRDVHQSGMALRPSIADGDGSVLVSDETFATTGMHFVAGDLDSFVTITDGTSTGAAGIYRVKAVTDGQTLELDGLAPTGAGTCTWVLEAGLKGILSSRSYADAVDRRGIPIADSGAEDETVYDATFTDVIDPAVKTGIEDEAGLWIFARSFGDEKDPNQTATDEGTRFFAQLITGANDGTATDSELESISGRSGSAASVTNGTTTVTGLSGMSEGDVGRYLSIWNTAVDGNQRHALITAYVSTSSVTVNGANFTTDGNDGSIEWQVSRHPGSIDFYNGDRYRLDELSETAGRTTLIGGIVSDAALTQAINEIREVLGVPAGATALTLTNTGNYYVWSDLADTSNTSVEEALNEINTQIGDRDYTGTVLSDGLTITANLQELADAISASNITRLIERLTAAVPKNTAHSLPSLNAYTVDATDNGANMMVTWRKQWRDPGPNTTASNDYEETSGGTQGVTAGTITPYEKIDAGDSINYMILQ
jgi:hypothetical protein